MRRIGILGTALLLASASAWAGDMGVVSGAYINVRDAGRINSSQVAKRFKGERFEILNEKDNWLEVRFADGTRGWIAKWLVKTGQDAEAMIREQDSMASAAAEINKAPPPKILAPRHMINTGLPPAASTTHALGGPTSGHGSAAGSDDRPVLPKPPVPGRGSAAAGDGSGSGRGSAVPVQDGSGSGDEGSPATGSEEAGSGSAVAAGTGSGSGSAVDAGSAVKLTAKERRALEKAEREKAEKERIAKEKQEKKAAAAAAAAAKIEPGSGEPTGSGAPPKAGTSRTAEDYYNLAIDLFEKKQYQQALDANVEAAKLQANNAEILNNTGNCHFKLGNFREAVGVWLEALKLNPKSAKICNNLGIAYYQMDENAKAVEYYKKAVLFDPDFSDPYYNLASVYGFKGQYQDAIEHYQKYLERAPDPAMKQLT